MCSRCMVYDGDSGLTYSISAVQIAIFVQSKTVELWSLLKD